MANSYSPVIVLDTTNANLDLASLSLGDSDAPVMLRRVMQVNPTAGDKFILKDKNGNKIFEMYAKTTGVDESREFLFPIISVGLKMLTADITRTTGSVYIYFA